MPTLRYILASAISITAIGFAMLLGHGYVVRTFPTLVKTHGEAVQDGAKVTVQFQITPRDNPTTTYSDTEQFIQGQHIIPPGLEQRMAGMRPGESKTFPLSAEEGFGSYDDTKIQIIPTADLPLDAQEGDTVNDDAGRTARILMILPDNAVLDLNHPLAGQQLMVTLQIMTIENPNEETPPIIRGIDNRHELVVVAPETRLVPQVAIERPSPRNAYSGDVRTRTMT
jgi:FKBP-type peptidyl-prolyl cis-trans isomerase 2